jgi:hypothetical protein
MIEIIRKYWRVRMSDEVCFYISYLKLADTHLYYTDDSDIFLVLNPADQSRQNCLEWYNFKIRIYPQG